MSSFQGSSSKSPLSGVAVAQDIVGANLWQRLNPSNNRCISNTQKHTHCSLRINKNIYYSQIDIALKRLESVDTSSPDRCQDALTCIFQLVCCHVHRFNFIKRAEAAIEQYKNPVARERSRSNSPSTPITPAQPALPKCTRNTYGYGTYGAAASDSVLVPYQPQWSARKSVSAAIEHLLKKPLSPTDLRDGHIYVYSAAGCSSYRKIGRATEVFRRMEQWGAQCKRKPTLIIYTAQQIPHASLVEALIHAELKQFRRKETYCNGCGGSHIEWFEATDKHISSVLEKWVGWIGREENYAIELVDDQWKMIIHDENDMEYLCAPVAPHLKSEDLALVSNTGRLPTTQLLQTPFSYASPANIGTHLRSSLPAADLQAFKSAFIEVLADDQVADKLAEAVGRRSAGTASRPSRVASKTRKQVNEEDEEESEEEDSDDEASEDDFDDEESDDDDDDEDDDEEDSEDDDEDEDFEEDEDEEDSDDGEDVEDEKSQSTNMFKIDKLRRAGSDLNQAYGQSIGNVFSRLTSKKIPFITLS